MAVNIRSKERKHPFIDVKQRCSQTPSHVVSFPRFGFGTHGSYRDTVVIYNINIHISINIYIYININIYIWSETSMQHE